MKPPDLLIIEQGVCLLVGRGHGRLRISATGDLLDSVLDQSVDLVTVCEDGNREGLLVLNDGGECGVVLALCLACLQGRFGALDAGGKMTPDSPTLIWHLSEAM